MELPSTHAISLLSCTATTEEAQNDSQVWGPDGNSTMQRHHMKPNLMNKVAGEAFSRGASLGGTEKRDELKTGT